MDPPPRELVDITVSHSTGNLQTILLAVRHQLQAQTDQINRLITEQKTTKRELSDLTMRFNVAVDGFNNDIVGLRKFSQQLDTNIKHVDEVKTEKDEFDTEVIRVNGELQGVRDYLAQVEQNAGDAMLKAMESFTDSRLQQWYDSTGVPDAAKRHKSTMVAVKDYVSLQLSDQWDRTTAELWNKAGRSDLGAAADNLRDEIGKNRKESVEETRKVRDAVDEMDERICRDLSEVEGHVVQQFHAANGRIHALAHLLCIDDAKVRASVGLTSPRTASGQGLVRHSSKRGAGSWRGKSDKSPVSSSAPTPVRSPRSRRNSVGQHQQGQAATRFVSISGLSEAFSAVQGQMMTSTSSSVDVEASGCREDQVPPNNNSNDECGVQNDKAPSSIVTSRSGPLASSPLSSEEQRVETVLRTAPFVHFRRVLLNEMDDRVALALQAHAADVNTELQQIRGEVRKRTTTERVLELIKQQEDKEIPLRITRNEDQIRSLWDDKVSNSAFVEAMRVKADVHSMNQKADMVLFQQFVNEMKGSMDLFRTKMNDLLKEKDEFRGVLKDVLSLHRQKKWTGTGTLGSVVSQQSGSGMGFLGGMDGMLPVTPTMAPSGLDGLDDGSTTAGSRVVSRQGGGSGENARYLRGADTRAVLGVLQEMEGGAAGSPPRGSSSAAGTTVGLVRGTKAGTPRDLPSRPQTVQQGPVPKLKEFDEAVAAATMKPTPTSGLGPTSAQEADARGQHRSMTATGPTRDSHFDKSSPRVHTSRTAAASVPPVPAPPATSRPANTEKITSSSTAWGSSIPMTAAQAAYAKHVSQDAPFLQSAKPDGGGCI